MPRPKVRPEDRQRGSKACVPCRASKKRCDAGSPCSNCVRKDRPEQCHYLSGSSKRGASASVSSSSRHAVPIERIITDNPGKIRDAASHSQADTERRNSATAAHSPEAPRMTSSRMLTNARGDRVYIGNAASLSFLQLLRHVFTKHLGPSQFAESNARDVMLEAQIHIPSSFNFHDQNDHAQKLVYLESYEAVTSGLVDVFNHHELATNPNLHNTNDPNSSDDLGIYDLAIAIGAQCGSFNSSDMQYEVAYFSRGQRAAFAGMLEDPSLNLVRTFLLLAFYMLGACRRNAAFMYLGVAARAAHALGLHDGESYPHFEDSERSHRLRIWKSVRVLDFLVSSILGRPSATAAPEIRAVSDSRHLSEQDSCRAVALEATYRSCSIVEDIIRELCSNRSINADSAKGYLDRMTQWRESLPASLGMTDLKVSSARSNQAQVIGNMHVACTYYFGVMLVTRPFLISYLLSQLTVSTEADAHAVNAGDQKKQDEVATLAEVCIDSAVYMVQTSQKVLEVGLMLENMCILKAWIFAAGLIIGFSLFARSESDPEVERAFEAACRILDKIAVRSPQARHYSEIFSSMAEGIRQYRLQLGKRRRRSKSRYVDRIFSLEVDGAQQELLDAGMSEPFDADVSSVEGISAFEMPENMLQSGYAPAAGTMEDVFFGWDSFAHHFFDNTVPFGPRLDY